MSEVIHTGENNGDGYEYPLKCPLDLCDGSPVAMTASGDEWLCDVCGKVVIAWRRDDPAPAEPVE